MPRINGKNVKYHLQGVRGKVTEFRDLVEVIDQVFESFHKLNQISKNIVGKPKYELGSWQKRGNM